MLDEAGLQDCKIVVSNSLDEYIIRDVILEGACIDSFGVGERLITAKSEPVFGGVYKLAALETNGELTVVEKSSKKSVTAEDLKLTVKQERIPLVIISDGKLRKEHLKESGFDEKWVLNTIKEYNIEKIEDDEPLDISNSIILNGYICKQPVYRTTPFGREIADILLAVNRSYNKSDYIPCIAWGRNARYAERLNVGDNVIIKGRIQSREYQKKISDTETESKTAFEVSVAKLDKTCFEF
jgi:primosomal replication protein N